MFINAFIYLFYAKTMIFIKKKCQDFNIKVLRCH